MKAIESYIHCISGNVRDYICNLKDYRINRHIVVFESDDWGTIRVPSREVWEQLKSEGYAMDMRPYERYDTLETNEDVEALFDVLRRYKDSKGNHPVITANYLTQNPNFDAIRENGFLEYVGESIVDTYKSYPSSGEVIDLMKQGIKEGLVMPQCHGREHLNVRRWMKELQNGNPDILRAFEARMPGIFPKDNPNAGNQCVIALGQDSVIEQEEINKVVGDALIQFEQTWGFKSRSFVACNYTWNNSVEDVLLDNGVELIQTSREQRISIGNGRIKHYTGQRNTNGMAYSIRNCNFEPSERSSNQDLQNIINEIESQAFRQSKIAIFSTHRMNFVGGIDASNRDRTLKLLDGLLGYLINSYNDIEFISSNQLVDILK